MGYNVSSDIFYGIKIEKVTYEKMDTLPVYIGGGFEGDRFFGIRTTNSSNGDDRSWWLIANPTSEDIMNSYKQHVDFLKVAHLDRQYEVEITKFKLGILEILDKYHLVVIPSVTQGIPVYDMGWVVGCNGS